MKFPWATRPLRTFIADHVQAFMLPGMGTAGTPPASVLGLRDWGYMASGRTKNICQLRFFSLVMRK